MLCALLLACGTSSSSGDKGSTLDDSGAQTEVTTTQSGSLSNDSRISLRLTDAPIDNLAKAVVQFTAVELKPQSGGWVKFTLKTPKSIDLLQLQGVKTADLLVNVPAPVVNMSTKLPSWRPAITPSRSPATLVSMTWKPTTRSSSSTSAT